LDFRNRIDVMAAIVFLLYWISVSMINWVIMEVELIVLQPQVSEGSGRHEVSFHVASPGSSTLADHDISLLWEGFS